MRNWKGRIQENTERAEPTKPTTPPQKEKKVTGKIVDNYRLTEVIGGGSFAKVYK